MARNRITLSAAPRLIGTTRVSVFDGNAVMLGGVVDSLDAREAAEKPAWSVAGVQSIDDRLTVHAFGCARRCI